MNRTRSLAFLLPVLALTLLGQGCGGTATTSNAADGGVYKTADHGTTWLQKRVLVKGAKAVTLGNDPMTAISIDPEENTVLYAGTMERGIVMSLDGGDSWQEVANKVNKAPVGRIQSLAVDPKDKCTLYATMGNKVYKTSNCNRDWSEIFFDPKIDKTFTRIAIDWFNPTILFAGTSEGDIFKSSDAGLSWQVVKRANAGVNQILVDNRDSRIIYIATAGDGVWKTMDAGATWVQIKQQLQNFNGASRVQVLAQDNAQSQTIYLASKYGLLASTDGGETWKSITLTSQPGTVDITGLAVNQRNEKEITYTTGNTLFFTTDQGATWVTKKLPSTRPSTVLTLDQQDGKTLYIGFGAAKK